MSIRFGGVILERTISSLFLLFSFSCCEVGMWGSLPQFDTGSIYRPSSTSGTITNPTYAYDTDAPPWTTFAEKALVTGSTVAGTPDTDTVIYSGFTALSKVNFSSCTLQITSDTRVIPNGIVNEAVISSSVLVDFSLDGGSTWGKISSGSFLAGYPMLVDGTSYGRGGGPNIYLAPDFPAQDIAISDVTSWQTSVPYPTGRFFTSSVIIPSSAFAVGMGGLQIRFRTTTLKSVRTANPESSAEYRIYDIRATVN